MTRENSWRDKRQSPKNGYLKLPSPQKNGRKFTHQKSSNPQIWDASHWICRFFPKKSLKQWKLRNEHFHPDFNVSGGTSYLPMLIRWNFGGIGLHHIHERSKDDVHCLGSWLLPDVLGSIISVLGMVIPPFIGNPYHGYINPHGTIGLMTIPYYWE